MKQDGQSRRKVDVTAPWSRRRLLSVGAVLTGLSALGILQRTVSASARPRLFVFVPTLMSTRALSSVLESHLVGVQVTVFGRFADFKSAVRSLNPEGALSLAETLGAVGLKPSLLGIEKADSTEPYVVLTHRERPNLLKLSQYTLGMVDIVGRDALPAFAKRLLRLDAEPRIRRVLKTADLLPSLNLDLADGIVIPERFAVELQDSSRLNLQLIRPDGARLHRPAVALVDGKQEQIRRALLQLPKEAKKSLGIDDWKGSP